MSVWRPVQWHQPIESPIRERGWKREKKARKRGESTWITLVSKATGNGGVYKDCLIVLAERSFTLPKKHGPLKMLYSIISSKVNPISSWAKWKTCYYEAPPSLDPSVRSPPFMLTTLNTWKKRTVGEYLTQKAKFWIHLYETTTYTITTKTPVSFFLYYDSLYLGVRFKKSSNSNIKRLCYRHQHYQINCWINLLV